MINVKTVRKCCKKQGTRFFLDRLVRNKSPRPVPPQCNVEQKETCFFAGGFFFAPLRGRPALNIALWGNGARAFISHQPVVLGTFLHPCMQPNRRTFFRFASSYKLLLHIVASFTLFVCFLLLQSFCCVEKTHVTDTDLLPRGLSNELSKREEMGTSLWWQMRASGVEYYRTYENCENR